MAIASMLAANLGTTWTNLATNLDCDLSTETDISLELNEFASETGLYTVTGKSGAVCDGVSPKLHLNKGQTYAFHQTHISNWYHPVGFAYEPGGAHFDLPEVEGEGLQYYVNDVAVTDDESGFGLDGYEPLFFYPQEAWSNYTFKVDLTVPDVTSFYYFCHIHSTMSAMIEVKGATNNATSPTKHDQYFIAPPTISARDEMCGTVGLETFMDTETFTHKTCDGKSFLCGDMKAGSENFNECLERIDCKMHHDMAVHTDNDPVATFMRQMIPHHANAVSMAKVLKKAETMAGRELTDEVAELVRSIINVQNHQIQTMQGILDGLGADYGTKCYEDSGNGCPHGCVPMGRRSRHLLFATSPCGDGCMLG